MGTTWSLTKGNNKKAQSYVEFEDGDKKLTFNCDQMTRKDEFRDRILYGWKGQCVWDTREEDLP